MRHQISDIYLLENFDIGASLGRDRPLGACPLALPKALHHLRLADTLLAGLDPEQHHYCRRLECPLNVRRNELEDVLEQREQHHGKRDHQVHGPEGRDPRVYYSYAPKFVPS